MQLSSCARCGAPLPAVAADPRHPDRCGACATRAAEGDGAGAASIAPAVPARPGPWPTAPTAAGAVHLGSTPPPPIVSTRLADGTLIGAAAAGIASVGWWALCTNVDTAWWPFTSVIVGLIVGQGVVIGARRGGAAQAVIAALLSAAAVFVTVYFITRSAQIAIANDEGAVIDVSLWNGVSAFWDTFHSWIDYDATKAAGWLLAPLVAIVVAGRPSARPGAIAR